MKSAFSGGHGLRFKFVLSISLLLTITLGAAALYVSHSQERMLLDSLDAKARALGRFVALISPEAIYSFDITSLDRVVRQIGEDADVLFAQIRGERDIPMTTALPDGVARERAKGILDGADRSAAITVLSFPIVDEGEKLGRVLIAVDQSRVLHLIERNLFTQLAIYLGIILFLASVIFVIFHHNVLRQVNLLIGGANRVSRGNYNFRLPVLSRDELSQLTDCFNQMTVEIKHDRKKLESANEHLAAEVEQRKRAEERTKLAASVFTYAREGITITDRSGTIVDVNEAFSKITGYSRDEAIGGNPRILRSGLHDGAFYARLWDSLKRQGHWTGEIWNRHKNGQLIAELLTISAVKGETGETTHYVALFSDISAQKAHEKQLERIAHYDALTNLPNRVLLADRLHQAMALATRHAKLLAVAYLDLDGFKEVNDRNGHDTGDQLLLTVASRMQHSVRESDTLARLGGDEFVAVLMDLTNQEECIPLLERLLEAASEPVTLDHTVLQVSASIGVTFFPQVEEVNPDQLLRQADQAMYQAKLSGRNCYSLFDPEKEYSLRGQIENLDRIGQALERGEFELFYQPKVNLRSGVVIGAEALIRWRHPEKGLLLPGVFLPMLESHPLAVRLGEWVIARALDQLADWRAAGIDFSVSVNLDAYHLQQKDFVERLQALLAARPDVPPSRLQLEILETSTLKDLHQVSRTMGKCRRLGVEFALDDFGTGYSSLVYLKHLPATQLKIDQTFVRDMLDDPEDLTIVEGVLGLATAFQREIIAEGVETPAHGNMLLHLGCEQAQGYGIARPMPAGEIPAWRAGWSPDASWGRQRIIEREQFPILYAIVDHGAWVQAIDDCLQGKRLSPPALDAHQCRFGKWLDEAGRDGFDDHPSYRRITEMHDQAHRQALEILGLQAHGRRQEALERMPRLHQLRTRLLMEVNELLN